MIKNITAAELRRMNGSEGLVLQGCGGDAQEWVDGINNMLTEAGILINGAKFTDISVFEHNGLTNILFGMDDMTPEMLDVGKLAMWRLQTHGQFGGTWLSDYRVNQLGVTIDAPEKDSPEEDVERDIYEGDGVDYDSTEEYWGAGFRLAEEREYVPLTVYIENAERSELGGFTMPLPASRETFAPLLEGIEASCVEEVVVRSAESPIAGLSRAISLCAPDGLRLDELNYLAAKIRGLDEEVRDTFGAVIEAKRHCGSVAEIINITENLGSFYLQPAYSAEQYGEFLVNTARDEYAELFHGLEYSSDPLKNAFAAHIDRLEASVNAESYGKYAAAEERGVFTEYGYLTESDGFRKIYRGPENIPAEFRVFAEEPALVKVENADLGALLSAMHAVGGEYTRDAKRNIRVLSDGGTDYFVMMNPHMLTLSRAEDVYHRDTMEHELWMSAHNTPENRAFRLSVTDSGSGRITGSVYELDIDVFQDNVRENGFFFDNFDAEMKDGTNRVIMLAEWDAMDRLERDQLVSWTRHYDPANESQLAEHLSESRRACEADCRSVQASTFLSQINAQYMAQAANPQPDMIRVAQDTAKEMLARGDAKVYRLLPGEPECLSRLAVVHNGLNFSEHREFAVNREDIPALEKWAERAATDILRQTERGERKKSHGEEL
jgi:hypothetical protein